MYSITLVNQNQEQRKTLQISKNQIAKAHIMFANKFDDFAIVMIVIIAWLQFL